MYVIGIGDGYVIYDCLWQDSFPVIKSGFKRHGIAFAQVRGLLVSHFHPDHAGAFEILRKHGIKPLVLEWQMPYIEWLNNFYAKPKNDPAGKYVPIDISAITPVTPDTVSSIFCENSIDGKIIRTPGHSDDSVSLIAGNAAFVGDLPRLETAGIYGADVEASWREIASCNVTVIYYAHGNSPELYVRERFN